MITLMTGNTGSGKTAHIIDELRKIKDRPIFSMGIPELKLEHYPVPPVSEWVEMRPAVEDPTQLLPYFTFPVNSIVVIDEAQRVYRPRPTGSKVPDIVAAFETHRHTGVDFWLITQDQTFIDANARKLVKRHWHIHETYFGNYLLEWVGLGDPGLKSSRELARRDKYKPNPQVFDLYKSAEAHTKVKRKLPWFVYLFVAAIISLLAVSYFVWTRISAANKAPEAQAVQTAPQKAGEAPPSRESSGRIQTPQEYLAQYTERIDGLPHTAPAYDEITKPKVAPEPVGCVAYEDKCRCITQQGTTYPTTHQLCLQMVKQGPFFMPWKEPKEVERPIETARRNDRQPQYVRAGMPNPEWLTDNNSFVPADKRGVQAPQAVPQPVQANPMQQGRAG